MVELGLCEQRVLCSLVSYPDATDAEIAELVGYSKTRIKSIRSKLLGRGLVTPLSIPNFPAIGCELLTVFHGDFNPATPYNVRKKHLPSQRFEHVFLVATTDLQHVSMSAASNFTEIRKYVEYLEGVYGEHGFLGEKGNSYVHFPFELSKIYQFFNFGPLLTHHFGVDIEQENNPTTFSQSSPVSLGKNERKVLYELVKNPSQNDGEIAKNIGLSRQSVNAIKGKIIKKDLLHPVMFPNLGKLGFKILVFKYCRYNQSSPMKVRNKSIGKIIENPNRILTITSNLESVSFSVYKDYHDFEKDNQAYLTQHHKFLKGEPFIRVFALKELRFTFGRYAPLVAKVLELP